MVRTTLLAMMCFVLISSASAKPEFYDRFVETYAPKSALVNTKCGICHTSAPARNVYGKQLKDVLNGNDIIAAMRNVESADADGDGASNLDEIQQDTRPADPKDRRAEGDNFPDVPENHWAFEEKPAPPKVASPLFPTHSLHPVIVHFPIGLFLFGVFLELFGSKRADMNMRYAAMLCLFGGALSSYGAVITGLLFFFRGGFEWAGLPLNHFIAGVTATLLMTCVVAWRAKGAHESKAYFGVLLLAGAAVGLAGHLGGLMVFG